MQCHQLEIKYTLQLPVFTCLVGEDKSNADGINFNVRLKVALSSAFGKAFDCQSNGFGFEPPVSSGYTLNGKYCPPYTRKM